MPRLYRNMLTFTLALTVITLLAEYYRKGTIDIESPVYFFGAIILLGIVGGYFITWAYEEKDMHL